jgi:hypothetical protein
MNGLLLVSYVALWVLFLVVAFVLVSILRNLGEVYDMLRTWRPRDDDAITLIVGEVVPHISVTTIAGESVSLVRLIHAKTAIYIISPHCEPCRKILEAVAQDENLPGIQSDDIQDYIVISQGSAAETE